MRCAVTVQYEKGAKQKEISEQLKIPAGSVGGVVAHAKKIKAEKIGMDPEVAEVMPLSSEVFNVPDVSRLRCVVVVRWNDSALE